jgi:hypothetical protein
MPDDMRAELEAAAKKHKWSLTQELLWRVRASLLKEREDHRNRALRAVCFLISELGRRGLSTDSYGEDPWHRDPFTFRAFKLGVAKLLDALEPPGEIRPTFSKKWGVLRHGPFETPESLADYAASNELYRLFDSTPLSQDQKTMLLESELSRVLGREALRVYERELYAMSHARHDLGIDEPKKPES